MGLNWPTEPPFESFLSDSQTVTASLWSPRTVANSARRRCCVGGALGPLNNVVDVRGKDAAEELELCEGEGEGDPKNLLVDENSLEGKRRLLEN